MEASLHPGAAVIIDFLLPYRAPFSSSGATADPQGFELEQLRLLDNAFHCGVVAWILGHLVYRFGVLPRPPATSIISPVLPVSSPSVPEAASLTLETRLVQHLNRRQTHRGHDLRLVAPFGHPNAHPRQGIQLAGGSGAILWGLPGTRILLTST